jgi:general L-amino acid transport system permease protein
MVAEPIVKRAASLAATSLAILTAGWLGWLLLRWTILDATWNASSYADCAPGGACWAVLRARYGLILFGLFPSQEHWRPAAACAIVIATAVLFQWPKLWRLDVIALAIVAVAVVFLVLMYGGLFVAPFVSTERWGGFALTLYLYFFGVIVGLPFGVCLALLRRSRHSGVADTTAFVVDTARSLPMVMVLFTVGVLAPMVLPEGLTGDKLWRVALAFAFVYACYQSEIVRAGLQAVPATQEEAAAALALSPYWRIRLILLPQAITHGLPATINLLVATFKETSIVSIIGFFDFTASAQAAYGNADWANAYVEVYLFIGAVYFLCANAIAWMGTRIERRKRVSVR